MKHPKVRKAPQVVLEVQIDEDELMSNIDLLQRAGQFLEAMVPVSAFERILSTTYDALRCRCCLQITYFQGPGALTPPVYSRDEIKTDRE